MLNVVTLSVANKPFMLNVIMLSVVNNPFMLNVIILNAIMLNVVMLSVIMLSVVVLMKGLATWTPAQPLTTLVRCSSKRPRNAPSSELTTRTSVNILVEILQRPFFLCHLRYAKSYSVCP
jgi:hypothetical protein